MLDIYIYIYIYIYILADGTLRVYFFFEMCEIKKNILLEHLLYVVESFGNI